MAVLVVSISFSRTGYEFVDVYRGFDPECAFRAPYRDRVARRSGRPNEPQSGNWHFDGPGGGCWYSPARLSLKIAEMAAAESREIWLVIQEDREWRLASMGSLQQLEGFLREVL